MIVSESILALILGGLLLVLVGFLLFQKIKEYQEDKKREKIMFENKKCLN